MFRYAPTPSGFLHIGNGVNFVLTYLWAQALAAPILLRIDDLDADRKRPEYVDDVFFTLDWLGLRYDVGPTGPDDFERHWSQRHRLPLYHQLLTRLVRRGVVYASDFSRQQIRSLGEAEATRLMRAQNLSLRTPGVPWRVRVPDGLPFSDFVVRRRDGIPAYQVASLTDDCHFGVTHIVRGEDLRESTAIQLFLATLLNDDRFARTTIWHHPLLTDSSGQKLAKSAGSTSLRALRESGRGPVLVYQTAARLLGFSAENVGSLTDLQEVCASVWARLEPGVNS
ncbi:hypothetical protein F5984_18985 [Rudanella paleaurantiibacter]|uniref:Glutamyl/glutaminyl-tRNA synthetase class Ib catalytic domain-containing protein n=1 Tax=Rudanella paleaurantiibacter TaxID=2614655 RepID=A0A7J5TWQ5_9BACT|nr:glutamate--tRNA ligase family protein [Rudanella paleaurantiibacter]KAB7727856.1 hypothetical protein F5984_18985 [Rudanella paleaurantiibacter]